MDSFLIPPPSVYLALRANDLVRRFINIHLHYIIYYVLFLCVEMAEPKRDTSDFRVSLQKTIESSVVFSEIQYIANVVIQCENLEHFRVMETKE